MAKKKHEPEAEPIKQAEPEPEPEAPKVKVKLKGQQIGMLRREAQKALGDGASVKDVADKMNELAEKQGFDYVATPEYVIGALARAAGGTPRTPGTRGRKASVADPEALRLALEAVKILAKGEPIPLFIERVEQVGAAVLAVGGLQAFKDHFSGLAERIRKQKEELEALQRLYS